MLQLEAAGSAVRVVAARVGSLRAQIPWAKLASEAVVLRLANVEFVLAPAHDASTATPARQQQPTAKASTAATAAATTAAADGGSSEATGWPGEGNGPAGQFDGVRMISKLLEGVLLKLEVHIQELAVRVEGASAVQHDGDDGKQEEDEEKDAGEEEEGAAPAPALILQLRRASYVEGSTGAAGASSNSSSRMRKSVEVEGLRVMLDEPGDLSLSVYEQLAPVPLLEAALPAGDGEGAGAGEGGAACVELGLQWAEGYEGPPTVEADCRLPRLQMQASLPHLAAASDVLTAYTAALAISHMPAPAEPSPTTPAGTSSAEQEEQELRQNQALSRSILEALLLDEDERGVARPAPWLAASRASSEEAEEEAGLVSSRLTSNEAESFYECASKLLGKSSELVC